MSWSGDAFIVSVKTALGQLPGAALDIMVSATLAVLVKEALSRSLARCLTPQFGAALAGVWRPGPPTIVSGAALVAPATHVYDTHQGRTGWPSCCRQQSRNGQQCFTNKVGCAYVDAQAEK